MRDQTPAPELGLSSDPMKNLQSAAVSQSQDLQVGGLARYDRIADNILQPREFANRRRSAIMSGSPFESVRDDPFKQRAGRNVKGKPKRMPKGITPPISDPFHVSAPTHAQAFFNPLQSKSSRAALSQTAQVRALTAAAAASAQARAAKSKGRTRQVLAPISEGVAERRPVELFPERAPEAEPILAEFSDAPVAADVETGGALVMAADGQGPAPQHPNGPAASSSASAYYGDGRNGGGGGASGGGSGDGGDGRVDPVQDDIVAGVLVAAFALLFGWAGYNALVGSPNTPDDGEAAFVPQTPESMTRQIEDLGAPNPFPPGPIDIRPASPVDTAQNDTFQTQLFTPAVPEPVVPAQLDPQTPAEPQAPVASEPAPPPPACAPGRAMRAYFCTASANLTPTARTALLSELDDWGTCAGSNELVVRGFADTRGASSMNAVLAAGRAASVAALLRERGLSVTEVEGVGELSDIEDERNCANQRRVDVGIKGDPPPVSLACSPPREAQSVVCA